MNNLYCTSLFFRSGRIDRQARIQSFIHLFFVIAIGLAWHRPAVAASQWEGTNALVNPSEEVDYSHCLSADGDGLAVEICHYERNFLAGRRLPGDLPAPGLPANFSENLIWGTDLGYSVRVGDATLYFFGDSIPKSRWISGRLWVGGSLLGVPYTYDFNGDGTLDWVEASADLDGGLQYVSVTEQAAFDASGEATGLLTEFEQNRIFVDGAPRGLELGYSVPTGVIQVDEETIYYWYGKYLNNPRCDQSHLLAMDVASGEWRHLSLFAEKKFIQAAPVLVERDRLPPANDACGIPWTKSGERGLLIYGSGMDLDNDLDGGSAESWAACSLDFSLDYRESSLYLAYLSLDDLESPQSAARIYYYTGDPSECWARGAIDEAKPIIAEPVFGEFSVQPVPGTDYLILSYSADRSFNVRAARLDHPWIWTDPDRSPQQGYGDLLVAGSLRMMDSLRLGQTVTLEKALFFKRAVSTWGGSVADPLMLRYGVYLYSSFLDFGRLVRGLADLDAAGFETS